MQLEAILKPGGDVRAGVYYYSEVPAGIDTALFCDPTDKTRWTHWRTRNFEFLEHEMKALPPGLLVDVGAGVSEFRALYARFDVVPIDFCPFPLISVVSNLNEQLPLKDGVADVLMLSNVLEHISKPDRLLGECGRVLKPGGVVLGAVPFLMGVHQRPHDYFRYTDICLREMLASAGFTTVEVIPVLSPYAVFRVSAERLFRGLIEYERTRGTGLRLFLMRAHWYVFRWIYLKLGRRLTSFRGGSEDWPLGYHFKAVR